MLPQSDPVTSSTHRLPALLPSISSVMPPVLALRAPTSATGVHEPKAQGDSSLEPDPKCPRLSDEYEIAFAA